MSVVPVADVLQGRVAVDSEVTVRGWVRTRRDSKAGISFLAVYDGSCFDPVQAVINNSLPNYNEDVLRLTTGCSVIVTGKVVASPGQGQQFEIQASKVEVAGWVEDPDTYPMAAKRHSIEYLREVAHLRPRTNLIGAVARVRHTLAQALHRFFNEQGFFWVSTPLITASDTEGAGEMFRVTTLDPSNPPRNEDGSVDFSQDFFGKATGLTVSVVAHRFMDKRCRNRAVYSAAHRAKHLFVAALFFYFRNLFFNEIRHSPVARNLAHVIEEIP